MPEPISAFNLLQFWITSLYNLVEIAIIGIMLFFLIKIMRKYAKTCAANFNYNYFYAALALYIIYKLLWFLIFYFRLIDSRYVIGVAANFLLMVSGLLLFIGTRKAVDCFRSGLNAA